MTAELPTPQSDRDLYAFVGAVIRRHEGSKRTLEEYLRALWQLACPHRKLTALPVARFGELLEAALTAEVPPYEPAWMAAWVDDEDREVADFAGWEFVILRKIVDLRELRAAGAYDDDQRYFGIDSPRSGRWYNFDPLTFLECATAGSFDAWPDPDPDPDSAPEEPRTEVSWDDFRTFLHKGQYYE